MNDLPPAARLLVDVGDPHREIELLALLVGTGHALNTVAVSKISVGDDIEVAQLDGDWAVEATEEG